MPFHSRKTTRIPNYDYSLHNYYFITICTHDKKCIFGNVGTLNQFGDVVDSCIKKINQVFPDVYVDKYVIMPNHVHMILILGLGLEYKNLPNLSTVIGQFKMAVTKNIRQIKPDTIVWQRSFHDHIIRNQKRYELIWNYIEGNPLKWIEDKFYVEDSSVEEGQ